MDYLNIIYIALWGIIALYLFISAHKISNILYLAGVFFLFLFGWSLANQLLEVDLFAGVYNIIFRCIAVVFLVLILVIYLLLKKSSNNK